MFQADSQASKGFFGAKNMLEKKTNHQHPPTVTNHPSDHHLRTLLGVLCASKRRHFVVHAAGTATHGQDLELAGFSYVFFVPRQNQKRPSTAKSRTSGILDTPRVTYHRIPRLSPKTKHWQEGKHQFWGVLVSPSEKMLDCVCACLCTCQ